MKNLITKILTSKEARTAQVLSLLAAVAVSVGVPWIDAA